MKNIMKDTAIISIGKTRRTKDTENIKTYLIIVKNRAFNFKQIIL